jgi:hypothetical protein
MMYSIAHSSTKQKAQPGLALVFLLMLLASPAVTASTTPAFEGAVVSNGGSQAASNRSKAGGTMVKPDWIVEATTMPTNFDPRSDRFSVRPEVTIQIKYFRIGEREKAIVYEQLSYLNGRPLSLERKSDLPFNSSQRIAIRIRNNEPPAPAETKAAANIILRLVLDILLHHDGIAVVLVPDSSYVTVRQELQDRKALVCSPGLPAPPNAKVAFQLQSEQSRLRQTIYFL